MSERHLIIGLLAAIAWALIALLLLHWDYTWTSASVVLVAVLAAGLPGFLHPK